MNKASLQLGGDNWAAKEGKLLGYAVGDISGKYLPREFDFTRNSDIAATRVNEDGLIEKGRENLLLQSNTFDTAWIDNNVTLTSGQSGYDGTSDAWLLEANTASTATISKGASISGVMTASIYAKEGTTNWFRFSINDSGINSRAWFDLSGSGAVGNTYGDIIDANIESAGNGYFRCSITFNATAANLLLFLADANGSISPSSGDNIYIQDAQLEVGLVATDYIETTTTTAVAGITEDLPRLDYSGGASYPSLLLEPTRTNDYTNSEYFNDGGWVIARSSVTHNDATSPEGLLNAVKWQMTSVTGAHYLRQSRTSTDTWSLSIFIKKGNYRYIGLRCAASNAAFDLDTGTFSSGSGYVETLDNGWYRIGLTETGDGTFQYYGVYYANSNATERNDATGDEYYHIYGAQLESNASYPTSYIPTYGGSVTRSADSCYKTGISSLIGQTEGTIFIEFKYVPFALDMRVGISDGTSANYNNFRITSAGTLYAFGANSSVLQYEINAGALTDGETYKIALKYNTNDIEVFVNGISKGTDTSASPGACDRFGFDNRAIGQNPLFSNIKQTILFPTALSDAECIALTTI
jgi:hypothetical protein